MDKIFVLNNQRVNYIYRYPTNLMAKNNQTHRCEYCNKKLGDSGKCTVLCTTHFNGYFEDSGDCEYGNKCHYIHPEYHKSVEQGLRKVYYQQLRFSEKKYSLTREYIGEIEATKSTSSSSHPGDCEMYINIQAYKPYDCDNFFIGDGRVDDYRYTRFHPFLDKNPNLRIIEDDGHTVINPWYRIKDIEIISFLKYKIDIKLINNTQHC